MIDWPFPITFHFHFLEDYFVAEMKTDKYISSHWRGLEVVNISCL